MKRTAALLYGLLTYVLFLGTFLYAVGFLANVVVPKSIDSGTPGAFWPTLLIDALLLGFFAVQHSVMARGWFKRWWTHFVGWPIERTTFVLITSLILLLLYWQWRPLPAPVWSVESTAGTAVLWGLFALGWALVLLCTFLISHAHLFGLQQVSQYWKRQELTSPDFMTPSLYRYSRHPMMVGFLLAFWATPRMTQGHLLFAVATSGYILIALQFEEQDLVRHFGDRYRAYRARVPMLFPRFGRREEAGSVTGRP